MPPKNRGPKKQKPKSWSMYPALHHNITSLLTADGLNFEFHPIDEDDTAVKEYDTNIMGHFICKNPACSKAGWASKVVAITIRMYPNQQYNARVYHQRCQGCNSLNKPRPDDSYAERIAYRLKVWNGINVEKPVYKKNKNSKPHQSYLCEGCKNGHCISSENVGSRPSRRR